MITLVSISYTVDPVGNRTGETVGSTSTSFTMDNDDELTSTSGGFANSYSYNANGEQTGRTLAGTAYTLAFDYDGQLKSITQGTAVTGFGYDALGRRVSRAVSGTTTSTQYAGGAPVTEMQGSTFTAAYTVGNDLLRRNSEYPALDGLGSARAETNSSGTATATQDFDAFGNTIASSGSSGSPYNFAGDWAYQSNGDAGLQHVGARYFDPQVGRFASRDSMLDQIPYAYCGGEPTDFVDPSGTAPIWMGDLACFGVGGILIGAPLVITTAPAWFPIAGGALIVIGCVDIVRGIFDIGQQQADRRIGMPFPDGGDHRFSAEMEYETNRDLYPDIKPKPGWTEPVPAWYKKL
ncbi:MAG: RHS repeat-associated core domain-containing protein [Armatimonadetes bacterium]|nr:RHS repeat-associated core domain-containing protein [Armatimonadota bacterium]